MLDTLRISIISIVTGEISNARLEVILCCFVKTPILINWRRLANSFFDILVPHIGGCFVLLAHHFDGTLSTFKVEFIVIVFFLVDVLLSDCAAAVEALFDRSLVILPHRFVFMIFTHSWQCELINRLLIWLSARQSN
jgi:hypothetical protein